MLLRLFAFLLCLFSFTSCSHKSNPPHLIGAWKIDSTFSYYNGFTYTQREEGSDWATYVYEPEGLMKEIKYNSYQSYFFEWHTSDTLTLRPTKGGNNQYFEVLKLNRKSLVLKKIMQPIFGGNNQLRYEIRFLSKTDLPKDEAIPFNDPRK